MSVSMWLICDGAAEEDASWIRGDSGLDGGLDGAAPWGGLDDLAGLLHEVTGMKGSKVGKEVLWVKSRK